jgi:uncharacterized glyoxalase superfamily protein PhnB
MSAAQPTSEVAMPAIPLPAGYHTVNPYLVVDGAAALIDFLCAAFGGIEHERMPAPDGRIGHAEVRVGDSIVMLTDASEQLAAQPCSHYLYVDDVDAAYAAALAAGATSLMEPADQFYGDRSGGVRDRQGNTWWLATHLQDFSPDELARLAAERMTSHAG